MPFKRIFLQAIKTFYHTMSFDVKFYNVFMVSLAFMFIFTGFQTTGIIEPIVLQSIDDPNFKGDGYISLAIIYITFAICNWVTPSCIALLGAKWTMVLGAATYLLFMGQFLIPLTWLLYLSSILVGVGAPLLWTGQGSFFTQNSTPETLSRNSGMFWAMTQCSFLFGNLFVYFQFAGKTKIEEDTRTLVFSILVAVSAVGAIILFLLKSFESNEQVSPYSAFKKSLKLFKTQNILYLSSTFFYTGLYFGFFSIYSTAIGFTNAFPDAKKLVALSGMLIGVGEVVGGLFFGILGKKTNKYGRDPVIFLGMIAHLICYFNAFLNLPNDSPQGPSDGMTYITPSVAMAISGSFLLGFGDACFSTQIYSLLGSVYSEESSSAFAIFKFIQSVASAVGFFFTTSINLFTQLFILTAFCLTSTVMFWKVEWRTDGLRNNQAP